MIPSELQYTFQVEEVAGIMKVELDLFEQLWLEKIDHVCATGIVVAENLKQVEVERLVCKGDFLPHNQAYMSSVLKELKRMLE